MTLDFKKLITNTVKKQMKIQHFSANVQVFKRDEMPTWVVDQLREKFGESYDADGDFWIWLSSSELSKDNRENAFKVLNTSLGEAANNMTETDLKLVTLSKPADTDETSEPNEPEPQDDSSDEELDESVESPEEGEKFMFLKVTLK